jgi:uncharacterized protein (DUF1778 family)
MLAGMPLREVKLRISDSAWDAIAREAQHAGISFSEFVREAALARAAVFYARREGSGVELLEELVDAAHRFDQAYLQPPDR